MTNLSFHKNLQQSFLDISKKDYGLIDLKRVIYYESIIRYIETFGKQNVKIIIFEEFVKNQKQTVNDILKFLGINYVFENFTPETQNIFGIPRSSLSTFILKNVRTTNHPKLFPFKLRKIVRDNILLKDGKKPPMVQEDREFLQAFFEEDVREVEKILGRKLPWKNFTHLT